MLVTNRSSEMARNLTQAEYILPEELLSLRGPVTPEQFEQLCSEYDDLRLELTSTGELIVMPPTGSLTGKRRLGVSLDRSTSQVTRHSLSTPSSY